jgi:hypothetical protein
MRFAATSHQRRIVIALGCAALVFVLELGGPAAGHAQPSSRDRLPHELWNTYPLEPRTSEPRLRSENQSDRLPAPLPRSGGTPAGPSTGSVGGRPSGVGDGSSAPLPLSVLALALVGLIGMVLVARAAATVGRHVPGSVARFGSAVVSPVRSLATVSRPSLAGRGFKPAPGRAPGEWRDEEREENRYWRVWATDVGREVRAVLRAVTYHHLPEREEPEEPWRPEARDRIPFVIGSDEQGQPITATCPPTGFMTPVFFRAEVLERYYQDPSTYRVDDDIVRGGRHWALPIAPTDRNTVQAWLGDVNGLPVSVQRHWAEFAIPDQGVPEWRLRRELLAEFSDAREQGPVADLKRAIAAVNAAAEEQFGEALFAPVEEAHVEAVRTMRVPANSSFAAFNEQVRTLALLVVDHLSSRFLDAADAPADDTGTLNRLARLLATLSGESFEQAKDRIGGLYAVQSVRSNVASHRTGPLVDQTLARASISRFDLPAGYLRLVEGAAGAIGYLRDLLNNE